MTDRPSVSVVTVNYNGRPFLSDFFGSLHTAVKDYPEVEIIVVDNGSDDDSVAWIEQTHPAAKIVRNDVNNYARGVNLGVMSARGEYIALAINDAEFHPNWLQSLLEAFQADQRIGAVQSKILFSDRRRVNSAGVKEVGSLHFMDIGFGEEDVGQYDEQKEMDYFAGGSVMFRRSCLEEVGAFDEDFIMFMEDVDFSLRVRQAGWKVLYCPLSTIYHRYHGTSSNELRDYLWSRNRFFLIAKHFPAKLAGSILTSHFYKNEETDLLCHSLLQAMRKLARHHGMDAVGAAIEGMREEIIAVFGTVGAHNFFSRLELMLGLRKLRVGIYDSAFHFLGGGQKYAAFMARAIQEKYDVTFIVNKDASLESYKEWFDIDLSKCRLRIVKIPFYERYGLNFIDEHVVVNEKENPFDIISLESLRYDVFINSNMLGKVQPLSPVSIFLCHFPDREKERFFAVDQYDYLVTNSLYTTGWTMKRWGLEATHLIYPPIDMREPDSGPGKKENIILSVARFEPGGSKKQFEMAKAFMELAEDNYDVRRAWKLVLAGGNSLANPYFERVANLVRDGRCDIELKTNLSCSEIMALYKASSIFWHACGLDETNPQRVEHFGMTTVEAMQNYCVPIVINGGGQKEIVQPGISGFTFDTAEELKAHTLAVISDAKLRMEVAEKAYLRSAEFCGERFKTKVALLFSEVENELMGVDTMLHPSRSEDVTDIMKDGIGCKA